MYRPTHGITGTERERGRTNLYLLFCVLYSGVLLLCDCEYAEAEHKMRGAERNVSPNGPCCVANGDHFLSG